MDGTTWEKLSWTGRSCHGLGTALGRREQWRKARGWRLDAERMSWDPEFPAAPSIWSSLGSDSCRAWQWGCVPSALCWCPMAQGQSWSWHWTRSSHPMPGPCTSLGMGDPALPPSPGAGMSPQPAGTWGFLSSWVFTSSSLGKGGRDGREWDSPTAASGKAFGAQGGDSRAGGATQGEGTACARKCLAELKFWRFWLNIGQRPYAGREESSPVSPCPLCQQGGRC